jgi:hypothetical protein
MSLDRWAARVDAAVLLTIAGLHVAWGHGASWPLPDRETLSRNVLGIEPRVENDDSVEHSKPAMLECYAVATALTTAAALVADRPRLPTGLRRFGLRGLVVVLATRGMLGLTGNTRLVVPVATGPTFTRLDRRYYSPLCLLLAMASARSLRPASRR